MKRTRMLAGAFLAGGLWASAAFGQAPPAAGGAAAAAGVPGAAEAAAKPTFCEKLEKCCDRARRCLCGTPIGQMLNSITKPLSAATGGIFPGFCPLKPSEEETKKPGAAGAAAQALKDAVEAKERRAAVRILSTFDCHWYPEAEVGLAGALRTDRAECVRLEAAIGLNRGCCCTRLIVAALEDCVGNGDKYGPTENSPRVQAIAMMALDRCLQCPDANIVEVDPLEEEQQKQGETPKVPEGPGSNKPMKLPPPTPVPPTPMIPPASKGSGKPTRQQMEHARQTLAVAKTRMMNANNPQVIMPAGQRSLAGLAAYVSSKPAQTNTNVTPTVNEMPKATNVASSAYNGESLKSAAPASRLPVTAPAPVSRQPAATPAPVSRQPVADTAPAKPMRLNLPPATKIKTPAPDSAAPANSAYAQPISEAPKQHQIDPVVLRCLETLRDADDPEIRHGAVQTLVSCNWREQPESLSGLLYSARYDKNAGMRVACIRSLAAMRACTPEVMGGMKPMLSDSDDWIRAETKQAIAYLQSCKK